MASAFANALVFLGKLGLYDVILPFLLTFTIIYAIMDKTRILGYDTFDGKQYPKKNLNALVAFCIGFLVIASSNLVSLINTTLAQIVVLFMICVFYLALVGIFYKDSVEDKFSSKWKLFFMIVLLIAIVLIFANAILLESGQSVLEFVYTQIAFNIDSAAVSTIVLILFIAGAMWYIVSSGSPSSDGKKDGGDKK
jgi:hypothetical membrane protein